MRSAGRKVVVVVADGAGIGGAADADAYGTPGANTLGNLDRLLGGLPTPTLNAAGLRQLLPAAGADGAAAPGGVVARAVEASAGNDTPTGHWELMGLPTAAAPPTYPDGFPAELLADFAATAGLPDAQVLGNVAANGEAIIERLGGEHLATGLPIVYTSADSVFQIAAHTDVVPLERLYAWCEAARAVLTGQHAVGRVIARPFIGTPGAFYRLPERRDYALPPPGVTALELLDTAGVPIVSIGKIGDIFAHTHVGVEMHPGRNDACLAATAAALAEPGPAFIFTNLVDFDSRYGHARKPREYAAALAELDRWLATTVAALHPGDRLIVTADHGNDPTYTATNDHTRENVPIVAFGRDLPGAAVGPVPMAALGAAVCDLFDVDASPLHPTAASSRLRAALTATLWKD